MRNASSVLVKINRLMIQCGCQWFVFVHQWSACIVLIFVFRTFVILLLTVGVVQFETGHLVPDNFCSTVFHVYGTGRCHVTLEAA